MTIPQLPYKRAPTAIVIVAKCPVPGQSKTRLSKTGLLDDEGCAKMARAMLSDTILAVENCKEWRQNSVVKFLYFAPPPPGDDGDRRALLEINNEGKKMMKEIFTSLDISDAILDEHYMRTGIGDQPHYNLRDATLWKILPMMTSGSLQSSDLGAKLSDILTQTREMLREIYNLELAEGFLNLPQDEPDYTPSVAIVGMDSPELLPLSEISYALDLASRPENRKAYLSPSHDGGYGMICLPPEAKPSVFSGVRWSDPLTAVSQIKALTDGGVDVELGSLMRDIDEPEDLLEFAKRLCRLRSPSEGNGDGERSADNDVLLRPPPNSDLKPNIPYPSISCQHSWKAMVDLGLIDEKNHTVVDSRKAKRSRVVK